MRSLLLPLCLTVVVASGCSQNPHVDVSTPKAAHSTTAANAERTPDLPVVQPTLLGDRDGDGVPDDVDHCPDVPGPASNHGCPLKPNVPPHVDPEQPEPSYPNPWAGMPDRDGDGTPDIYDKCPDVPGQIFNDGCPVDPPLADRDGDGVPDIYDKCPGVPGPVYNDGCPLEAPRPVYPPNDGYTCPYPHAPDEWRRVMLEVKESLKFDFDRSTIKAESFPALHKLERFMRKYPTSHLYMVGHADDRGTLAYNQALSTARVYAVKDFLVHNGIAAQRISADARGKTEPLVNVDGLEGDALDRARALNRRVDLEVRYQTEERVQ